MKKFIVWLIVSIVTIGGAAAAYFAAQPPRAAEGVRFLGTSLEKKTRDEVLAYLEAWWQTESQRSLSLRSPYLTRQPEAMTLADLGIEPDWDATLAAVKFHGLFDQVLGREGRGGEIEVIFKTRVARADSLSKFVEANALPSQPPKVTYEGGRIVRRYEVTTVRLDQDAIPTAALEAYKKGDQSFELPVKQTEGRYPRQAIDGITDVVSEFSTKFSEGKVNRSSNIRLAASLIDGTVLMPGEVFSYNKTVGRRTSKTGFKLAGVYLNGRHEVDYGGGICQVSTTLFNAALLANLKIRERQSHGMPVPYVPLGRDATVDYGTVDLKFENTTGSPIAISAEVTSGQITFRILGKKDPSLEIEIFTTDHSSWGNSVKYVDDPSLPPGKTKVIEKGSTGHSCRTWRLVKREGKVVSRENLGPSLYRANPKIVARGPAEGGTDQPQEPGAGSPTPGEGVRGGEGEDDG